ncbi:MAG: hypothetical protein IH596_03075, partial [Bacteroidales bacterium]|nr:hypothetical protein [Bacteroidales bacterium]
YNSVGSWQLAAGSRQPASFYHEGEEVHHEGEEVYHEGEEAYHEGESNSLCDLVISFFDVEFNLFVIGNGVIND